jgi:addiction module HigA family antidote
MKGKNMKDNLPPSHPGIHIKMSLDEMELTSAQAAAHLGCSRAYMSDIINGKRDLSIDMCFKISGLIGSTPEFWAALQTQYDIKMASRDGKLMTAVGKIRSRARTCRRAYDNHIA